MGVTLTSTCIHGCHVTARTKFSDKQFRSDELNNSNWSNRNSLKMCLAWSIYLCIIVIVKSLHSVFWTIKYKRQQNCQVPYCSFPAMKRVYIHIMQGSLDKGKVTCCSKLSTQADMLFLEIIYTCVLYCL